MILAIGIIVYILTVGIIWYSTVCSLREERDKVTVADVLNEIDFICFVPIVNTIAFVVACVLYFVWIKCKLGCLCKTIWNKIKSIEL